MNKKLFTIIILLSLFTGCYDKGCQQHTMAQEAEKQTEEMKLQTKQMERIAEAVEALKTKPAPTRFFIDSLTLK